MQSKKRDVAVIDIANDFIQTQTNNEKYMAIIKICRILVDILLDISPDVYGTYITTDRKGTKQLLTQCMNSIYVTMVESVLYYCKFYKKL